MENKRYKKEQDIHLTKEEYLAQLKKYLKRLPKEDYNNAMDYFTEYFEDAGPEATEPAHDHMARNLTSSISPTEGSRIASSNAYRPMPVRGGKIASTAKTSFTLRPTCG